MVDRCVSYSTWGFTDRYAPSVTGANAPANRLLWDANYLAKPAVHALVGVLSDNDDPDGPGWPH